MNPRFKRSLKIFLGSAFLAGLTAIAMGSVETDYKAFKALSPEKQKAKSWEISLHAIKECMGTLIPWRESHCSEALELRRLVVEDLRSQRSKKAHQGFVQKHPDLSKRPSVAQNKIKPKLKDPSLRNADANKVHQFVEGFKKTAK